MAHWTDQSEDGNAAEISVCAPCASDDGNPPELMSAGCSSSFACGVLQSSVIYLLSVYGPESSKLSVFLTGESVQKDLNESRYLQAHAHRSLSSEILRFHSIIARLFEVWEMREKVGSPGKSRCSFINRDEHKAASITT